MVTSVVYFILSAISATPARTITVKQTTTAMTILCVCLDDSELELLLGGAGICPPAGGGVIVWPPAGGGVIVWPPDGGGIEAGGGEGGGASPYGCPDWHSG